MEKYLENKQSKEIYNNFQKILYEHYENESENRNAHIVDIFPSIINSSNKYGEYEEHLLHKSSPLILNKFVLAMMKIYMYDEDIYYYTSSENKINNDGFIYIKKNKNYTEYISKYKKSLKEFLSDVRTALNSYPYSNELILFFKNLQIGFVIEDGHISYTNFGTNKEFIDNIFKSEGLFIRT